MLDELDEELARRRHRFVRYADDCNIYVRSERAGHRVMASVTRFIEKRMRLRLNRMGVAPFQVRLDLASGRKRLWAASWTRAVNFALRTSYFAERGLMSLERRWKDRKTQTVVASEQLALPLG